MVWAPGEVVLYSWAEWLKEQQHLWAPAPESKHAQTQYVDSEVASAMHQVADGLHAFCSIPSVVSRHARHPEAVCKHCSDVQCVSSML